MQLPIKIGDDEWLADSPNILPCFCASVALLKVLEALCRVTYAVNRTISSTVVKPSATFANPSC